MKLMLICVFHSLCIEASQRQLRESTTPAQCGGLCNTVSIFSFGISSKQPTGSSIFSILCPTSAKTEQSATLRADINALQQRSVTLFQLLGKLTS